MPGNVVSISPVVLRTPSRAVILGSNVSNWLGPPCWNRKITDRSVSGVLAPAAARVPRRCESDRPPRLRVPIRRKARRLQRLVVGSQRVNLSVPDGKAPTGFLGNHRILSPQFP